MLPPSAPAGYPEMGLRELKKQMTRESIANAAFTLTLQKGLESVTIDEITRLAFVSPRTFSNHFTSKEEAVVSAGALDVRVLLAELAERPADEPPLQALCATFSTYLGARSLEEIEHLKQQQELAERYPTLQAARAAQDDHLEDAIREAIAERTGTDPTTSLYPWLVASAATSAVRAAFRIWIGTGDGADRLTPILQEAFNAYSDGLPTPACGS